MPGAPDKAANAAPAAASANAATSNSTEKPLPTQNKAAQLEEDDEFEDFPVEGE